MPAFRRYAIFYTPAPGPLARFGAAWLGWDIAAGATVPAPLPEISLPAPRAVITEGPRRYGFHATIAAPFHPAPGVSERQLTDRLDALCAGAAPVPVPAPAAACMGRFIAIRPQGDEAPLRALAAATLHAFDPLRAPASPADIARKARPSHGPELAANLRRWGHPHVMEAYRWHMTLTARRPEAELEPIMTALAAPLKPLLAPGLAVDALSLCGEDASGHFHEIHRARLRGRT